MDWALGVALGALGFTIASFWWLNARKGSLTAARPRTYAFASKVRLRFPLAFYNTGATALIVSDLRLIVEHDLSPSSLDWLTTRSRLRPEKHEGVDFAKPFTIQGRSTREVVAEFGDDVGWAPLPNSKHRLRLETQIHPADKWVEIVSFDWWAPQTHEAMAFYIAHRNAPGAQSGAHEAVDV
jgi:hypothetical protein